MRTETINIYKFDELNEESKQFAIDKWREIGIDDCSADERVKSYELARDIFEQIESIEGEIGGKRLVAYINNNFSHLWMDQQYISKHEDGKIKNCYYSYKYDCTKKKRSNVFTANNLENCPLTGVCYDHDFLQPIIDFLKSPKENYTNQDLADDFPSYESIADRDIEYLYSDESIMETIECNDYDFTEDGKMY